MITFIALSDRTSGIVRGQQLATRVNGGQFIDLNDDYTRVENRVVIVTRNYRKDVVTRLKNSGHVVGYDIADMPVGDLIFRGEKYEFGKSISRYAHNECDFFVVNNDVVKNEVNNFTSKPCFVIPHHHCNFENIKPKFNDKVRKIGYVGLPEQLSKCKELRAELRTLNIEFVTKHPDTREECVKLLSTLDIGIVFTDVDEYYANSPGAIDISRTFKPNVKLTNYQSCGVPTIAVDYQSYAQFGNKCWIKVNSFKELLASIKNLVSDTERRKTLSERSYENAQKYHIVEIIKLYENLVNIVT